MVENFIMHTGIRGVSIIILYNNNTLIESDEIDTNSNDYCNNCRYVACTWGIE